MNRKSRIKKKHAGGGKTVTKSKYTKDGTVKTKIKKKYADGSKHKQKFETYQGRSIRNKSKRT